MLFRELTRPAGDSFLVNATRCKQLFTKHLLYKVDITVVVKWLINQLTTRGPTLHV